MYDCLDLCLWGRGRLGWVVANLTQTWSSLVKGSFRAGHKSIQYVIYQVSQEKGLTGFSPGISSNEREMKVMHKWQAQAKKKPAVQEPAGQDMRRDKAGSRHALPL
jgi:hypothetical protein